MLLSYSSDQAILGVGLVEIVLFQRFLRFSGLSKLSRLLTLLRLLRFSSVKDFQHFPGWRVCRDYHLFQRFSTLSRLSRLSRSSFFKGCNLPSRCLLHSNRFPIQSFHSVAFSTFSRSLLATCKEVQASSDIYVELMHIECLIPEGLGS